jgi:hypothetical protein
VLTSLFQFIAASLLCMSLLSSSTKATKSEVPFARKCIVALPGDSTCSRSFRLILYHRVHFLYFFLNPLVRSKDKGEYLVKKFPKDFEYVIVEDLENENGFDDAVKGVDAVEHTASPFHFKVDDPYKDLVNPAVNGTLSVLKSALKNGDKVQRIVGAGLS